MTRPLLSPRLRSLRPLLGGLGALALVLAAPLLPLGCKGDSAGRFHGELKERDRKTAPSAEFGRDVETVWARTKETLSHLSARVPSFDDATRQAYATVDEGAIRAAVEETTPGRARIYVKARKFGLNNDELAQSVLDRIGREIER